MEAHRGAIETELRAAEGQGPAEPAQETLSNSRFLIFWPPSSLALNPMHCNPFR